MFGNNQFFGTRQFREMTRGFRECIKDAEDWFQVCLGLFLKREAAEKSCAKACASLQAAAAIALELSQTSIRSVKDLWSPEKIELVIQPELTSIRNDSLKEIIIRSFEKYLQRPGHVKLPNDMISQEEYEKERESHLLRVRRLWEFWHGSQTLDHERTRRVSTVPNQFSKKKTNSRCAYSPGPR